MTWSMTFPISTKQSSGVPSHDTDTRRVHYEKSTHSGRANPFGPGGGEPQPDVEPSTFVYRFFGGWRVAACSGVYGVPAHVALCRQLTVFQHSFLITLTS